MVKCNRATSDSGREVVCYSKPFSETKTGPGQSSVGWKLSRHWSARIAAASSSPWAMLLMEFSSAIHAVRCAIELQSQIDFIL
jgi:hypothetical protein